MTKKKQTKSPAQKLKKPAAEKPSPEERKAHWQRIGLSLLSGCLWFLACADFDIWPFAYFAMVPVFFAFENAPTRRKALFYGWLAGLVANAGGFYWITMLLERFGHLPMPVAILGLLLLAAYQAVAFWLFFMLLRVIRRRSKELTGQSLPMVLLAPLLMVSFEYLVPFLFPWYLAITQAWVVPVIQIADLAGPLGVSGFLMLINGAIYDVITCSGRRRTRSIIAAAAATALVLGYGFVRMSQVDAARNKAVALQVGVVQGNIPFDEKGINRAELAAKQLQDLQAMSAKLESEGADFLMWTESSYPYGVPRDLKGDFAMNNRRRIRRGFEAPIMLGALTFDRHDSDARPFNSALMLASDDQFLARFDKIFLLMFGEYIPLLETFPALEDILPRNASHFSRGKEIVTFPLEHDGESYRLGPMICYEDILTDFGRKLAANKPHLLVNITNDSWFGDTSEPWEHLALSVYRAVEMRTDLVRAVNTGVSAFVDANGRVYAKTYAVDPKITPKPVDGLLAEVKLMEGGHTFFARFGDIFAYLCILATLFFWQGWPRLQARKPESEKTEQQG
ncbi:MAG: apolipoprotein N-acyltransferase [Myxococcales bacterium]|nr:apolipoprotein N-acyltransferase [Myxococcales bacterium]